MNHKKKMLDKIKGKKEKLTNFNFTEEIISEDPFDIFYTNSPITLCEEIHVEEFDTSMIEEVDTTKIINRQSDTEFDKENIKNTQRYESSRENIKNTQRYESSGEKINLSDYETDENPSNNIKKDKIIDKKSINIKKSGGIKKSIDIRKSLDIKKSGEIRKLIDIRKSGEIDKSIDINKSVEIEKSTNVKKSVDRKKPIKSKKTPALDDDFLAALTKPKEVAKKEQELIPSIIIKLEIYTSQNLVLTPIPMYKFPHIPDIKYEPGKLFKSFYCIFVRSLLSIFKSKQDFILKYRSELIIYENGIMRSTLGLERILKNNDIEYEAKDFLIIKDVNINLVIDFLLNEPLNNSYTIPFIMSRTKFINGIYYEINITRDKSAVKDNEQVLYKYTLDGPFFNDNFIEYFKYKHKVA